MAVETFLDLDPTTGFPIRRTPVTTSSGVAQAGKHAVLDDGGHFDISLMPSGLDANVVSLVTTETIADGAWVNIYNNSGTAACRKALATDTTKPCRGFVLVGASASGTVSVYKAGKNTKVPVSGFTAADIGKVVYLSASVGGTCTTTPPTTTGNLIQPLGTISDVGGTYIVVDVTLGNPIIA